MRYLNKPLASLIILLIVSSSVLGNENEFVMNSPDGKISTVFSIVDGHPNYSVRFNGELVLANSGLGIVFKGRKPLKKFKIIEFKNDFHSSIWKPVWGQYSQIKNEYNEFVFILQEIDNRGIKMNIVFRIYDDGVAFRYIFPKQKYLNYVEIIEEQSFFNFAGDFDAWWIPNDYDSYEYLYRNTKLSKVVGVNTPFTLRTNKGTFIVIHEAELVDYSGMTLERTNFFMPNSLRSVLVPGSDGTEVKTVTPFQTPWRVILISSGEAGIITSNIIENLNPPCSCDNIDWVKPIKYIGVWWGMHIGKYTWVQGDKHGASDKIVKEYIDFAAENNIQGVLVEGWNKGWENWGKQNAFDYITPYEDFNLPELSDYAASKGLQLVGHHETGGDIPNYEKQLDSAFAYYKLHDINYVKTGYAGPTRPKGVHHHSQQMVNHYNRVVKKAFDEMIMLDVHEPIKLTGLSRTYPNLMTGEGVRGMEWNAWSDGNPPAHTTILPFTRCFAGPIDYTPGIFDLKFDEYKKEENVKSTIAKQLALYVVLYSPMQMAADLIENYLGNEAFSFIKNVPVTWDSTIVLNAKIGDYVTLARRKNGLWFIGSITDENPRTFSVPVEFLNENIEYSLIQYSDGVDADYINNPQSILINKSEITNGDFLKINMVAGGGYAAILTPNK